MRSGSVGLTADFFSSDTWSKPRRFTEHEAMVDLIGCACFGIPGTGDGVMNDDGRLMYSLRHLAIRWRWPRQKVAEFLEKVPFVKRNGNTILPVSTGGVRVPSASRPKPEGVSKTVAERLHALWQEQFASRSALTEMRRQKYNEFWREHVEGRDVDGYALFQAVCAAVKNSAYHMSDRAYQLPESIFRNEERRDRWARIATEGQTQFTSANTRRDLEKFAGFAPVMGDDSPTADRNALLEWYNSQPHERQQEILAEKDRRYAMIPVKARDVEKGVFFGILEEMTGAE